jgi:hypothetical protein
MASSSPALRALLTGLIDYAGLFPPAALPMDEAVQAFATYRRGGDEWVLGRFVVPVTRLAEFSAAAAPLFDEDGPWRLSVLATPADASQIDAFNAAHAGRALIDCVEGKATTAEEVAAMATLKAPGRQLFVELPLNASTDALVKAVAAHGLFAKMRTGGITADAFPSAGAVVLFLDSCVRHGVPSKATAGLHHPVRGEYRLTYAPDSATGTMFGFLNVICAAMLIGHGLPIHDAIALLEERDPKAFRLGADGIGWRDWLVPIADIRHARVNATNSFGSCSFVEPLNDLKRLAFL